MSSPSENPPLRKQAAWVVGWRIVGILATLATNIVAARVLGPAEFGVFLLVTTMIALGGVLGSFGLNEAGLRFISESLALHRVALARAYLRRTRITVALASLAAAVVIGLAVSAFQSHTALFGTSNWMIALAAAGVLALAWQMVTAESLRGLGELRWASLFSGGQTGGPVPNLIFLVILLVAALSLRALDATTTIGLMVVSLVVSCPLAVAALRRTSQTILPESALNEGDAATLSPFQGRELLMVAGVLLLNQLLAFGSQQLDIWLGGAMLDPEQLGLYGAAKRSLLLAAMPVQMAMMTVLPVIPRLRAQRRTQDLERVVRSAATYAAIPGLAAMVALVIFPGTILHLIFGGSYEGAAPIVMVMAIGHLVLVLSGNPPYVLTMSGKHRIVLVVNLLATLVLLVAGVIGTRLFGAIGLAAASAASVAFQNGMLWWLARRQLGVWTHVGMPLTSPLPQTTLVGSAVVET